VEKVPVQLQTKPKREAGLRRRAHRLLLIKSHPLLHCPDLPCDLFM